MLLTGYRACPTKVATGFVERQATHQKARVPMALLSAPDKLSQTCPAPQSAVRAPRVNFAGNHAHLHATRNAGPADGLRGGWLRWAIGSAGGKGGKGKGSNKTRHSKDPSAGYGDADTRHTGSDCWRHMHTVWCDRHAQTQTWLNTTHKAKGRQRKKNAKAQAGKGNWQRAHHGQTSLPDPASAQKAFPALNLLGHPHGRSSAI
jgi:hypothetical protein